MTLQRQDGPPTGPSNNKPHGQAVQRKTVPSQPSRSDRRSPSSASSKARKQNAVRTRRMFALLAILGVLSVCLTMAYFALFVPEVSAEAEITTLRESLDEQLAQLIGSINDSHYTNQYLVEGAMVLDTLAEVKDSLPAEHEAQVDEVLVTQQKLRNSLAQYGQNH